MNKGRLLFGRFSAIWGNRFTELFQDSMQVDVWADEWGSFIEQINPEFLRKAIDHCRLNLDWPPVMSEFLRICESMDDSLPDFECAFQMAVNRSFRCPEVHQAFAQLDSWKFRHADDKTARKMFRDAWNSVLQERRKNNLALPAPAMEGENGRELEDYRQEADRRRSAAHLEIAQNPLFGGSMDRGPQTASG